jgi:hypothetical protein
MLPTEVEHKSFQVQQFNEEQSNDSQVDDLTRLEELHEVTVIQSAKHQQAMRNVTRGVLFHVVFKWEILYYERSK